MLARFCGNSSVVFTLGHLTAGDPDVMKPRGAARFLTIKEIVGHLKLLEDQGLTRVSRKGWQTLEHPHLGTLQWKLGRSPMIDGATGRFVFVSYFFIRINGRLVLQSLPVGAQPTDPVSTGAEEELITCAIWVAGFKKALDIEVITTVCLTLGSLEGGSFVPGYMDPLQLKTILLKHMAGAGGENTIRKPWDGDKTSPEGYRGTMGPAL